MNYIKHYLNLIFKYGFDDRPSEGYYEHHHVVPKCIGGPDHVSNMVWLSVRHHFIAHQLLMHHYKDEPSLKIAFATMSTRKGIKLTSRQAQTAREAVSGDNSMRARAVVTPLGEFPTVAAAARAHGVVKAIISKKCGSRSMLHKGYYWKDEVVKGIDVDGRNAEHLRKRVLTPFGEFESVREAGRVLGIYHSTISKRIKRGDAGYAYVI